MPASSSPQRRLPLDHRHVTVGVPARVVVKVLLIAGLMYAAMNVVVQLAPFFLTLMVAGFLAVAADPLVRGMQDRGLGRGASVGVMMLAIVVLMGLIAAVFVPPLVEQGERFVDKAPGMIEDLRHNDTYRSLDQRFDILDRATAQAEKLPARVSSQLGRVLGAVLAGVFGTITILFLMVLLLMGGGDLVEGVVRLYPPLAQRRWWSIVQGAYRSIGAYVAGTLLVALIAGTTIVVSLLVLGLPYPLPLGLWMMLLGIIPLVGATIGAIPAVIVAFAAGGLVKGLVMLGIVIVYQQVENIYIQPTIQGKVVSLPPLIIFISVLVGSQLMGVLGALFAVPLAGILQIFYRQYVESTGGHELELPPIAPDDAPDAPDITD